MLVISINQPFAYAIVWAVCVVLWVRPGIAAECQRDNFDNWLETFNQQAMHRAFRKERSRLH